MPDDIDRSTDAHRATLDDQLNDGGGCLETWAALSELRGDGSDTAPAASRRGFLQRAATAAGISVGAMQVLVRQADAATQRADVTEVTGGKRRALLGRALGDSRTRKIRQKLVAAGHTPRVAEAHTVRTEYEGEAYHTVVVPFATRAEDTQAYIAWSDNPSYDVQVAGFRIVHRTPPDQEAYWDITFLHVEGGEVVVEDDRLENFLGCDDVSWGCVLTLAGAYAATFISCAACVASSGWLVTACAQCIAAILGSAGATLTCDWCND